MGLPKNSTVLTHSCSTQPTGNHQVGLLKQQSGLFLKTTRKPELEETPGMGHISHHQRSSCNIRRYPRDRRRDRPRRRKTCRAITKSMGYQPKETGEKDHRLRKRAGNNIGRQRKPDALFRGDEGSKYNRGRRAGPNKKKAHFRKKSAPAPRKIGNSRKTPKTRRKNVLLVFFRVFRDFPVFREMRVREIGFRKCSLI